MDVPVGRGGATLRFVGPGEPPLRERVPSQRVVSVLFDDDVDSWRRGWDRVAATEPDREAVIVAGDTTRGAVSDRSPGTLLLPDRSLAYTILDDPDGIDPVLVAVNEYLDGVEGIAPTVMIDDITATTMEPAERITFVDAVCRATARVDGSVVVGCQPERAAGTLIESLTEMIGTVRITDWTPIEQVGRLRREDPTTFGYTRQHWVEAQEGIEVCDRNYPQSKQVHAALSDPETTPRTLGATLSGLVTLDALHVWGKTVGSTRYDLTEYDPAQLVSIGVAFAVAVGRMRPEYVTIERMRPE